MRATRARRLDSVRYQTTWQLVAQAYQLGGAVLLGVGAIGIAIRRA